MRGGARAGLWLSAPWHMLHACNYSLFVCYSSLSTILDRSTGSGRNIAAICSGTAYDIAPESLSLLGIGRFQAVVSFLAWLPRPHLSHCLSLRVCGRFLFFMPAFVFKIDFLPPMLHLLDANGRITVGSPCPSHPPPHPAHTPYCQLSKSYRYPIPIGLGLSEFLRKRTGQSST